MKQRPNSLQKGLYKYANPELFNLPVRFNEFNGMPYRQLGQTGLQVSNIGLGTWKMGYPETDDGSRTDEKGSLAILDRSAELGVNFWDTANRYNNASGNSERIIGTWFANNPSSRRNIIVCTKLGGAMDGRSPNHGGLSRQNILDATYASLERLGIDSIDLLYFHLFDPLVPPEESLLAIEDLVKQDLVRYFAVSNFTTEHLSLYESRRSNTTVRSRIAAVQNQYDLLFGERDPYKGVASFCAEKQISFIAWSPMARGLLTDRYLDTGNAAPGHRLYDEGGMSVINDPVIRTKLQSLSDLALSAGLSLSQLVIAYMLTIKGMGPVIAACSTVQQLESNAAAGKIILTQEQTGRVKQLLDV
jgi:aryl-alcohol dehydrogenase-like predicted oxidoreductase